jgi:ACS family hexuronate transporter-like MFS transporter
VNGFIGARIALGLGEGGNFPSSIKAVAHWFPKRERAFATALFNSGANVGAIVAPAIVPVIAAAFGWRAAFIVMGAVGFLWLLLWFPLYDDPERSKRLSAGELTSAPTARPARRRRGSSAGARSSAIARPGRSSSPSC